VTVNMTETSIIDISVSDMMRIRAKQTSKGEPLCNPEPDLLEHIPRMTLGPDNGVKGSLATVKIRISGVDEVSALEDSPEEIETKVDWDSDVVGDEALVIEAAGNGVEAVEEDDEAEENGCGVCEVWLER
jgi:hypothetical protein